MLSTINRRSDDLNNQEQTGWRFESNRKQTDGCFQKAENRAMSSNKQKMDRDALNKHKNRQNDIFKKLCSQRTENRHSDARQQTEHRQKNTLNKQKNIQNDVFQETGNRLGDALNEHKTDIAMFSTNRKQSVHSS